MICPRTEDYPKLSEKIDGINIYRHSLPEAKSKLGYPIEYGLALFFQFFLALFVKIRHGFGAIHACNPPDLLWMVALPFKLIGVKFVFDHHDICPELFETKFKAGGVLHRLMFLLEKISFKLADKSIATNKSYRDIAVERGGMKPEDVYIVRSAPDLQKFDKLLEETIPRRLEGKIKVGYVGVMGNQEGIDLLLESAAHLKKNGYTDIKFTLIGSGPEAEELKKQTEQMNLTGMVHFTGRISDKELVAELSGADICVNPDRATAMNDKSTMNKIMEYMALKKPIVQFDLTEGHYSAREASLYAEDNSPADLARKIKHLANHPEERREMGEYGRRRLEQKLSWNTQKQKLTQLYNTLLQ